MQSLVITSDKKREIKQLQEMAEKMGLKVSIYHDQDLEDLALLKCMEESRRDEFVSEEEVVHALQS